MTLRLFGWTKDTTPNEDECLMRCPKTARQDGGDFHLAGFGSDERNGQKTYNNASVTCFRNPDITSAPFFFPPKKKKKFHTCLNNFKPPEKGAAIN